MQVGKENGFFQLIVVIHCEEVKRRTQSRNLKTETEAEAMEECSNWLAPHGFSTCFFKPRPTCPWMSTIPSHLDPPISIIYLGKCPTGLQTGQSNRAIFSIKISSSQVTLACQFEKKCMSTHTMACPFSSDSKDWSK